LDDDDEVLENKNSCTMAGGEPTYLVMRGGNPGGMRNPLNSWHLMDSSEPDQAGNCKIGEKT
jgi:hypothetical protein